MTIKDDPQTGLWDEVIEDLQLEWLVDEYLRLREEAREFRVIQRELKRLFRHLQPGRRYRIGRVVVEPRLISGGGFEVPAWTTKTYKLEALD